MKTTNYNLELMTEYQVNKEVIFNGVIYKIDFLLNKAVKEFVNEPPVVASEGDLYIIKQQNKHIKLISFINDNWCYFTILPGAIFYIISEKKFYLLCIDNIWQPINISDDASSEPTIDRFTDIEGVYELPNQAIHYLYINHHVKIILNAMAQVNVSPITIMLKQNVTIKYNILFDENIIWPINYSLNAMNDLNVIYMIKLYKLPDSQQYIADITADNKYSY